MALIWSWGFGVENQATLTNMAAFTFTGSYTPTTAAGETYTYSVTPPFVAPVRYAGKITGNNNFFTLPTAPFTTLTQGFISSPIKIVAPVLPLPLGVPVLSLWTALSPFAPTVEARIVTATGALSLYIDNVFQANTPPIDWTDWKYISLRFDLGSTVPGTIAGQIYIDGVSSAVGSLSRASQTGVLFRCGCPANNTIWGQFAVWNAVADSAVAPFPRYVTRVQPTTDNAGATVGTWVPGGTGPPASNAAALSSAPALGMSTTTFTQEASPASGERVAVNSQVLSTALGGVPPSVVGITLHTYSSGQSISARSRMSDDGGVNWASGANTVIDGTNTTYAFNTATTKPSTGTAWTGADTVTMAYEVV